MWGAIAGDIIGSAYERHNTSSYDFDLFTPQSQCTDDTVLTVAVADALMSGIPISDALRKWAAKYPLAGYGPGFLAWLGNRGATASKGNGAAIRVSAIAKLDETLEGCQECAESQARITHDTPEGVLGAKTVATAIFLARRGYHKEVIAKEVSRVAPTYNLGWPQPRKPSALARESVPAAIAAFLASKDFEDAIRKAVSLGGDSDSSASMAGSIAEYYNAFSAIPHHISNEVATRVPEDVRAVLERFRISSPGLYRKSLRQCIEEIIRDQAHYGVFPVEMTFPSGRKTTFSCSHSTGIGSGMTKNLYRKRFGTPPPWLNYCHPYHCIELCRLAMSRDVPLPESMPDLEEIYFATTPYSRTIRAVPAHLFGAKRAPHWDELDSLRGRATRLLSNAIEEATSSDEWIACSFQTVVIRANALTAYPGGVDEFSRQFSARHNMRIIVACSMGGDEYLDEIVEAAEQAGANRQEDIAGIDAYDLSRDVQGFRSRADGSIQMEPPWLEGRIRGGRVEVRWRPQ